MRFSLCWQKENTKISKRFHTFLQRVFRNILTIVKLRKDIHVLNLLRMLRLYARQNKDPNLSFNYSLQHLLAILLPKNVKPQAYQANYTDALPRNVPCAMPKHTYT